MSTTGETKASLPAVTLNNGVEIPQLGFGVFQVPDDETTCAPLAPAAGRVVIPKSVTPAGIREHPDVFVFALSDEELAAVDALDAGRANRPASGQLPRPGRGGSGPLEAPQ